MAPPLSSFLCRIQLKDFLKEFGGCSAQNYTWQVWLSVPALRRTRNRTFLCVYFKPASLGLGAPCTLPCQGGERLGVQTQARSYGHLSTFGLTLETHFVPAKPRSAASFPPTLGQTETLGPCPCKGMTPPIHLSMAKARVLLEGLESQGISSSLGSSLPLLSCESSPHFPGNLAKSHP